MAEKSLELVQCQIALKMELLDQFKMPLFSLIDGWNNQMLHY